ncbi:MAG: hypothetical protein VB115_04975 [Christensenellaceae bacterium]|nr:hypothetical protein [Christensenellaceae bacterium]
MRKLIAMILVLVSVFALAAPAMAAKRGVSWHSIEIDDPHDGIAPCLYKKMKATSSNVVKNLQDTGLTYVDVKFNTKTPTGSLQEHTQLRASGPGTCSFTISILVLLTSNLLEAPCSALMISSVMIRGKQSQTLRCA